jgi:hypothetical protein
MWCVNYCRNFIALSLLLLSLAGLSSCSVRTLSDVDLTTSSYFQHLTLPNTQTRSQQLMNRALSDYIGQFDPDAHYVLFYELSSASRSVLSSAGEDSSINNTKMSVSYQLRDIVTDDILTSGTIDAFATSGAVSSFHGQDMSEDFADERLIKLLGERLFQKLQLYFLTLEV